VDLAVIEGFVPVQTMTELTRAATSLLRRRVFDVDADALDSMLNEGHAGDHSGKVEGDHLKSELLRDPTDIDGGTSRATISSTCAARRRDS
jgi:hypothetical protein